MAEVGTVRILYGAGTISIQAAVHPKCMLGALKEEEERFHLQQKWLVFPVEDRQSQLLHREHATFTVGTTVTNPLFLRHKKSNSS